MPWSAKSFAERHNHALKGKEAKKAAEVANAVLKESGDEGKAARIANYVVKRRKMYDHPRSKVQQ